MSLIFLEIASKELKRDKLDIREIASKERKRDKLDMLGIVISSKINDTLENPEQRNILKNCQYP
jgi:hypothetical protein